MLPSMKLTDNVNLRECSSIRRINCLIKLKGEKAGYLETLVLRNRGCQEDRASACQDIEESCGCSTDNLTSNSYVHVRSPTRNHNHARKSWRSGVLIILFG